MEPTSHNPQREHTYQFRVPELFVAIVRELFVMLFCTYFAIMAIDVFADAFVSNVLDTDIILWALVVVGVFAALLHPRANATDGRTQSVRSRLAFAVIAGAVAAAVVWAKAGALGTSGIVYALASGIIVAVLCHLLSDEQKTTDHSTP